MEKYTEDGLEIMDQREIELPVGLKRPETLQEMIARMVRQHSMFAEKKGHESFEESDDFDVEDEELPESPYQMTNMQEETPRVRRKVVNKKEEKQEEKEPSPESAKGKEPAAALKPVAST